MKKVFVLGLFFFTLSCKKDNVGIIKKEIVGTWEIEKYSGYPFTQPPYPPGNGKIIMIGSNGILKGEHMILYCSRAAILCYIKKIVRQEKTILFY